MSTAYGTIDMDIEMNGKTNKVNNEPDLAEEKRSRYTYNQRNEYMGVGIDEWIDEINNKLSFRVSKIGSYTKSVYTCSIDTVLSHLTRTKTSLKEDITIFMKHNLDPEEYLSKLHENLTKNFIAHKNYCLQYGIKNKAASPERNDWYTTHIYYLDEEIKTQYLEIIHAILTNVSSIMICSCMETMTL